MIWKLLLVLILLLSGCSAKAEVKKANEELSFMVATDLHYLSKSLYEKGVVFDLLLSTNDGKLIEKNEEILQELKNKILEQKPDTFLFTGDITFNGEMASLLEVKKVLKEIEEAGIPVLVLPGNHDIDYLFAESYMKDGPEKVQNISQKDFLREMKQFGYKEAVLKDRTSFSYLSQIAEDYYILALDCNTEKNAGSLSDTTMRFMKDALSYVKEHDGKVFTMTHQNLLKPSETLYQGYVIHNYEEIVEILRSYDVPFNLSGHSHIQHIAEEDGFTDYCTESLAIFPLRYGKVTVSASKDSYTYSSEHLSVLQEESQKRFEETAERNVWGEIKALDIPSDIKKQMISYAVAFNKAYFTDDSDLQKELTKLEGLDLWKAYAPDSFWYAYMNQTVHGK